MNVTRSCHPSEHAMFLKFHLFSQLVLLARIVLKRHSMKPLDYVTREYSFSKRKSFQRTSMILTYPTFIARCKT